MSFAEELLEQPDALRRTVDHLEKHDLPAMQQWADKLKDGSLRRVVFTGMGSSYYAATPALLYLNEHGIDALSVESSELLYYGKSVKPDPATLVVAASQSGQSVEVVKLLDALDGKSPVIGITNDPASALSKRSNTPLHIQAGQELTVSTKTYTSTLAALDLLARALCGEDTAPAANKLHKLADYIQDSLDGWGNAADTVTSAFAGCQFAEFLGRGPSRASAMTAALITKESCKLPTEGMVSGMFRHGPMEVAASTVVSILFIPAGRTSALNIELADTLAKVSGPVCVIGEADPIQGVHIIHVAKAGLLDEWLAPIAEIIPVQMIDARLSARRGFDTGKFIYGSKVTVLE